MNESNLSVYEPSNLMNKEEEFVVFKCDPEEEFVLDTQKELTDFIHNVIVTDASVDMSALGIAHQNVTTNIPKEFLCNRLYFQEMKIELLIWML